MAEVFYTGVGSIELRSKPRFESINSGKLGTTFRDTTKTTLYTKVSGMRTIDEKYKGSTPILEESDTD